jgi:uncharacterized protein (DUF1800 family)
MLIYLDNRLNRKGRPQENYGREVMELFSMGVGNYTENDVREVSRALTGESLNNRCSEDWPFTHEWREDFHDINAPHVIFGHIFNIQSPGADTDHVIDLILAEISGSGITPAHSVLPATSIHMAWKLLTWFVHHDLAIDHPAVPELAQFFLSNSSPNGYVYDVRETLRRLLRSQIFYSPEHRYNMVKTPADYAAMALRNLELQETSWHWRAALALQAMGMGPFEPPNVAGWNHGHAWINSSSVLARFNYADRLSRTGIATNAWCDGLIINGHVDNQLDDAGIIEFFRARLLQAPLSAEEISILQGFLLAINSEGGNSVLRYRRKVRGLLHLFMTMPRYQLK